MDPLILSSQSIPPVLEDHQWQYRESQHGGILLGGSLVTNADLPVFDVTSVEGLFPRNNAQRHDVDGRHGSHYYVGYLKPMQFSLMGTLYIDPSNLSIIDELKQTLTNDGDDWPLFYKLPGVGQRYILCQTDTTALEFSLTQAVRTGSSPFRINFIAKRPWSFSRNRVHTASFNVSAPSLTMEGNTDSYPIFRLTNNGTLWSQPYLQLIDSGSTVIEEVQFGGLLIPPTTEVIVDFARKVAYRPSSGTHLTGLHTAGDWWSIPPNFAGYVRANAGGGGSIGAIYTVYIRDAWL